MTEELLDLEIGSPAHGGHCVARHEGRVVFVRHAAPGERVLAAVTSTGRKFWRAEAVQILRPSPDRISSRWPEAGPGGVGGAELAHLRLVAQRRWKRDVVLDAMRRIAHLDSAHPALSDLLVEAVGAPNPSDGAEHRDDTANDAVELKDAAERENAAAGGDAADPGDADEAAGWGYRTRVSVMADERGRASMYRHRSKDLIPVQDLLLADERIRSADLLRRSWPPGARIQAVAPSGSDPVTVIDDGAAGRVREVVDVGGDRYEYRVRATGFWQVHRHAPAALVLGVLTAAEARPGERVADLYSGAGLFSSPLADAVGSSGSVMAVESDAGAGADARRNAHGRPQIHLHSGPVAAVLDGDGVPPCDVVVLDPPRVGAGPAVMEQVLAWRARRIVYVACDPAALARDVAIAERGGYSLTGLRALDLFPQTHHVECLAVLEPR